MTFSAAPAGGTFRRALTNSGWLLGANGVTGVASLTQAVLLTRALGVQGYGVLAVVTTVALVLNRLASFRMNEFVVKYLSDAVAGERPRAAAAAVKLATMIELGASAVALGLVLLLAPLASAWFLRGTDATGAIRLAGLMVLAGAVMETSQGVLHAFDRFRWHAIASAVGAVVSLTAVAVAFWLDGGLEAMILALAAGATGTGVVLGGAAYRTAARECGAAWWRVPLSALDGSRRKALGFAMSTNASATLGLLARDADPLWLGLFRGPTEVAYYRLGFQLATYLMLPVTHLGQAFYPEIARYTARYDWRALRRLLRRGTVLAATYLVPAAALAALFAAPVVRGLYGEAFAPAALVFGVLLAGMGFANLIFWSRPALLAMGRPDYPLKVSLGTASMKLIGVFLVIPLYGYIGNAVLLTVLYLGGVSLTAGKVWLDVRHRAREVA